ncbi:MAG: hypothetical protein ACRENF_01860, partial [Thermodesulfobacteriota bacterium]
MTYKIYPVAMPLGTIGNSPSLRHLRGDGSSSRSTIQKVEQQRPMPIARDVAPPLTSTIVVDPAEARTLSSFFPHASPRQEPDEVNLLFPEEFFDGYWPEETGPAAALSLRYQFSCTWNTAVHTLLSTFYNRLTSFAKNVTGKTRDAVLNLGTPGAQLSNKTVQEILSFFKETHSNLSVIDASAVFG